MNWKSCLEVQLVEFSAIIFHPPLGSLLRSHYKGCHAMLLSTEMHSVTTIKKSCEGNKPFAGYANFVLVILTTDNEAQSSKICRIMSHLSLRSFDQIIPQNQSIAVPQPNANIINLIRVVGAWKEAIPTKERTLQNAKPCMVPENRSSIPIPVNMGDRIVTTNAS